MGRRLVAVITGASSGIGEATARRIAREPDSSLVLVARREQRLRALADALGAERVSCVAVDVTDEDAPAQIHDHVRERHGRVDLLVNNAGAAWRARFGDGGYENVRRTMALNFDAQLRVTEALLELLRSSAPSASASARSRCWRRATRTSELSRSRAMRLAAASPIPLEAPVITATSGGPGAC